MNHKKQVIRFTEFKDENLIFKGFLDSRMAFCGPGIVQIDITNRCNNNCLCCWSNSPLLGKMTIKDERNRQQELPLDLIKKTIEELYGMGTKALIFSGGGEPFIHPNIMEILRHAKRYNMRVVMNTNFTLLDEEKIYDLVDLKINYIHVSLLAGTAKTYATIHPNKTEEDFYRIKESLIFLARLKDVKKAWEPLPYPHINAYYVIFNKNYREIESMLDLAIDVRANSLEFAPVDVIRNKTDILLLNQEQIEITKRKIRKQIKKLQEMKDIHKLLPPYIEHCDLLLNRFSSSDLEKGEYETEIVPQIPCYAGWVFARIMANGDVISCLKAHRMPVGNIYRQSFKKIWNSRRQQIFRLKALNLKQNSKYFKKIGNTPDGEFGCLKSCDNIVLNIEMHDRFEEWLDSQR